MNKVNLMGLSLALLLGIIVGFLFCWFLVARPAIQEAEARGANFSVR